MSGQSRRAVRAVAGRVARLAAVARGRRAAEPQAERAEAGQPPTAGSASVAAAVSAAVTAVPEGSRTVRVPDRLPPVPVDQDQLERVLVAMVRAAWLRTPPGTRVLVQAAAAAGEGRPDVLEVRVTDRGPNLAGEAKSWLLADPSGSDGGLPAAVREFKASGGGRITLEDNPAGGLVLVLTLPVVTC
ncbi:hypothetical protein [Kitasatospora sp. NPDC047058]|uniref:hypothetical protein n=1 Tax=Kitasatospora sp. NPDC047058 TaxID=3155620 RepID=UPI0034000686